MTQLAGIYLDHAATTPLREEVLEAMLPWLRERHGNASSLHRHGRACRHAIEDAREAVAALINAEPREIIFTSGGAEANNLALAGVAEARGADKGALIVSAVEHHSVLDTAKRLHRQRGLPVHVAPVESTGRLSPDTLEDALAQAPGLVSLMLANNETGVLQPVAEVGAACRARGAPFHSDLVQAAGKLPLDVGALHLDLAALSAHKFGGPKGVGACYLRHGLRLVPQLTGGGQERGRRAGTENVAGIVGFGIACTLAQRELHAMAARLAALREELEEAVLRQVPLCWVNGAGAERLPHILNVGFEGVEGEALLLALDAEGVAVATGAACSSGAAAPSHVLLAMGQSHTHAQAAIRFSLGRETTEAEIRRTASITAGAVQRLRAGVHSA